MNRSRYNKEEFTYKEVRVVESVDKFDSNIVWLIKIYSCGHFWINKRINGIQESKKYIRVTRRELNNLGIVT